MIFRKVAVMAAVLALSLSAPQSSAWHVVAPVIVPIAAPHGGHGMAAAGGAGAAIAGGFIAAVAVAIVVHEIKRKRCDMRHSTWVDTRHDMIPKYRAWVDPCKRARIAPVTKLWPNGK